MSKTENDQELFLIVSKCRKHLETLKYSHHSVERNVTVWNQFIKYCCRNQIASISYNEGQKFISEHYGDNQKPSYRCGRLRSIRLLCDFNDGVTTLRRKIYDTTYAPPIVYEQIYNNYIDFRTQEINARLALKNCSLLTLYFLRYVETIGIMRFEDIEILHILNFIESKGKIVLSHKAHICVELGKLMSFAFANGYISKNLTHMIPKVLYDRKSNIPFALSKNEVEKILCSVSRDLPIGKRDYAILLMAARLGIRSSDICNLKFSNINWRTNQIKFIQIKTRKEISLPLSNELGEAVIDYIKNGRPDSESKHLFIRHSAPFDFLNSPATHHIFNIYLNKAEVPVQVGRPHGLHCLRHSVAGELLNNDVQMTVVSEILGHSDLETTNIYAKIDIKQLRKCALEVPSFGK